MIVASHISKYFGNFAALDDFSCSISDGCIYGLVGSNGAGKSTFLRLISGVYSSEKGDIHIDGEPVFDNMGMKQRIVFVPDELYFLPRCNMQRMTKVYASMYEKFSYEKFYRLAATFDLDIKKKINTFSKGMKRQAATVLALSCNADYIMFDETFDGLDPVMRNLLKRILYADICERNSTIIISSHSLRELEDTCDQLAMLHSGRIIFESDVMNLKTSLFKIQVAFSGDYDKDTFKGIDMLHYQKSGSVATMIVRGNRDEVAALIKAMNPLLFEIIPLSLEEVFVYEMDALGYECNEVLL